MKTELLHHGGGFGFFPLDSNIKPLSFSTYLYSRDCVLFLDTSVIYGFGSTLSSTDTERSVAQTL